MNPINGIKARAGTGVTVSYVDGASEHVQTPDIAGAVAQARTADVAIVFASYGESETQDLDTIDLQNQQYSEGLNVGYRWYGSRNVEPLFPFGFGLSYTTFGFSNLVVTPQGAGGTATVTATVTNTGTRAGADVVQLYVGQPTGNGEPPKQLKGFKKVQLNAGQSQTVSFPLTWRTGAGRGRQTRASTASRSATLRATSR